MKELERLIARRVRALTAESNRIVLDNRVAEMTDMLLRAGKLKAWAELNARYSFQRAESSRKQGLVWELVSLLAEAGCLDTVTGLYPRVEKSLGGTKQVLGCASGSKAQRKAATGKISVRRRA